MKLKLGLFGVCLALLMNSCGFDYVYYTEKQEKQLEKLNLPEDATSLNYTVNLPNHLTSVGLFARDIDGDKARLGRVLFYDKNLSSDGKVSCASCHLQDKGFSDNRARSKGVNDRESARNSIALSSVVNFSAYYGTDINGPSAIRFGWDNLAGTVTEQSRNAFTNPNEMNMHMHEIVAKVKREEYYIPLFQKAYNADPEDDTTIPTINEEKIFDALTHFINAMSSYNSRFDEAADKEYVAGTLIDFGQDKLNNSSPLQGFTADENAGKALYMANCASCHTSNQGRPTLNYANNGLDAQYTDRGVGAVTGVAAHEYQFKVPTLRNIEFTAPYMHDGRFATLDEVIDHYSTGVKMNTGLSPQLKSGSSARKMNFSPTQKAQLIAFLKTLSDVSVQKDERFANPFK